MRCLSIIFLLSQFIGSIARAALPGSEAVSLSGSFEPIPQVPILRHLESAEGPIFGEWPTRTVASGRAVTGTFVTPAAIEFEVGGLPKAPGIRLYLEEAANPAQTLDLLLSRNPNNAWLTSRWQLPGPWQQRAVRLVAEDQGPTIPNRWIALTLPREAHVFAIDSFTYAGRLAIDFCWECLLLVLPGLAFALWFSRNSVPDAPRTFTLLLTGCALPGLLSFFCFVINFKLGLYFSLGSLAASVAAMVVVRVRIRPVLRSIQPILILWFTCAALYTSAGLFYRTQGSPNEITQDRFSISQMPPDNILPLILGERIYNQAPFRPTFFSEIQSSDRPPLQTGIMLLHRYFWREPDLAYLLLGVLLQTSWIPALWVLLKRMAITGPPLLACIAVPALSYFAFVHEVFVWPKLLSAAFGLLAISCFGWFTGRETKVTDAILGGSCTALAMLSHSGIMMTVIAFALITALGRKAPWRVWVFLLGTAALVYLPWVLYQKLFDPPGDALLKLHLAGVIDRNHSLTSLLLSGYGKLGFAGWFATKWTNIRFLFWPISAPTQFDNVQHTAYWITHISFFHLFPSLGFTNIGFFLWFKGKPHLAHAANRMLLVAFASLAAWVLIMFAPESTTIHQGSFAMVLLFFAALTLYTTAYSQRAAAILVILQFISFLLLVVLAKPLMERQPTSVLDLFPDVGMIALFTFTLTCLAIWFHREWRYGGPLSA